jgi:hypothetical protein
VDCRTVWEHLEILTPSQRSEVGGEIAGHLSTCDRCRSVLDREMEFDRRTGQALAEVDVPGGLEERILTALHHQSSTGSETVAAEPVRHSRRSRWGARLLTGIAACALIAVALIWWNPVAPSFMEYGIARQTLTEQFRGDASVWETLPEFDGNFVPGFDQELAKLRLSAPRGFDLNGDSRHDVAVYRFSLSQSDRFRWQGVLVVLPADRFEGEPESASPRLLSGQRSLEWRSVDGSAAYLCFVHTGSVERFATHLFGPLA